MALVKATIKNEIKSAFTAVMDQGGDEAVVNAIKSVQLTYTAGLVAPTGGGPVTGTLQYTVS